MWNGLRLSSTWTLFETNDMEHLKLNAEQIKAAKAVYRAMRKASKFGVSFWDNYGTLTAYNSNKIRCPKPDSSLELSLEENDVVYSELLDNYESGNADDDLFFDTI